MQATAAATAQVPGSVFDPDIRDLPSGYTGLPRQLVEASQRQRLLYGTVVTVAEKGYGPTTIADIAKQAGVSKKTFYEHFADKQASFLAAYEHGRDAMLDATRTGSLSALNAGASAVEQLRASTDAYLEFLILEEFYARVFFIETLSAGPQALAAQRKCRADFTHALHGWHNRARTQHPDWPAVSDLTYEAATGAVHEITLDRVALRRTDELLGLGDELVTIQLAVLRVPEKQRAPLERP
jgi:AcrR family transcriptional regulator